MKPERWDEIVALFEQALERPPDERDRFLDEGTGDAALRERVAAMLRADAEAHPLFDATPEGLAASVRGTQAPSFEGRRVGPYVVLREIGRGGMATVYCAEDAKHHRSVALKLLHAGTSTALGGERFRREIDLVARLQHPHILPLYDSGETEGDGLLYYVMPFVAGGTLRDRIAREGQLPIEEVRRVTAHVAAGLDYAHRHGVVHRDVKPANVLLDEDHAAIADFGIAQPAAFDVGDRLTLTGVLLGTPAYMSPEHAAGASELDARSDIYSLACVVFEMLTGEPPFQAATAPALLAKHLRDPVPSARAARPALPPQVDEVLRTALAKDPAARFASAREFAQALDAALEATGDTRSPDAAPGLAAPSDAAGGTPTAAPTRRRTVVARSAAAALVVAVGAAVLVAYTVGRSDEVPSIAVLPFVNMSDDRTNEYFSDGVTEELTGALAQLGRIRVTPRTTAFAYKGRTGDIRRIGEELGVSRILEGSVRRDSDQVVIVTTLYDAGGSRLWSDRYQRPWRTVLALQSEIAGTIAEQLRLNLVPGERTRLAERHSVNSDAYDSYLKGRYFFEPRTAVSLRQATAHFQRALAIDSTYARAHAGLADTYSILAWTGAAPPRELFPLAERAARRALALDSTLAEPYLSLGIIHTFHTWDWAAADRATARAIALDSTLAIAWYFRTWHLIAEGRYDEGLAALRRAHALEPLSLINNARIGTVLIWLRRPAEAEAMLRKTLEIDPTYPVARVQLARVLSFQGRHPEAIAALPPDSIRLGSYESGIAGLVYARAGRRAEALAAARALESRPYVPAEGVAAIYAGLGDRDAALTWLERAVEARGVGLIFLAAEPMYDSLRDHPRYRRVVERIGLGAAQGGRVQRLERR
jgi:serine/threonine-protein kinase